MFFAWLSAFFLTLVLFPSMLLLSETPSRMVVTTWDEARLQAAAPRHGVPCARLGKVGGDRLTLLSGRRVLADTPVAPLHQARMSLERVLG